MLQKTSFHRYRSYQPIGLLPAAVWEQEWTPDFAFQLLNNNIDAVQLMDLPKGKWQQRFIKRFSRELPASIETLLRRAKDFADPPAIATMVQDDDDSVVLSEGAEEGRARRKKVLSPNSGSSCKCL